MVIMNNKFQAIYVTDKKGNTVAKIDDDGYDVLPGYSIQYEEVPPHEKQMLHHDDVITPIDQPEQLYVVVAADEKFAVAYPFIEDGLSYEDPPILAADGRVQIPNWGNLEERGWTYAETEKDV